MFSIHDVFVYSLLSDPSDMRTGLFLRDSIKSHEEPLCFPKLGDLAKPIVIELWSREMFFVIMQFISGEFLGKMANFMLDCEKIKDFNIPTDNFPFSLRNRLESQRF